jgi:dCMP deaminase
MALAVEIASRSNCVKSHVGTVLFVEERVRTTGYNGTISLYPNCFDGGCPRCKDLRKGRGEDLDRCVCVHAEENALVSAARHGIPVQSAESYVTHEPCLSCTKLLIQAGVSRVVFLLDYEYPDTSDHNDSREAMRRFSKDHHGTLFERFDRSLASDRVKEWEARLEAMKVQALDHAQKMGFLIKRDTS